MHEIVLADVCPTVHQIILSHVRVIHKTIVVVIHVLETILVVKQQSCGKSFGEVNACICISLYALVAVAI